MCVCVRPCVRACVAQLPRYPFVTSRAMNEARTETGQQKQQHQQQRDEPVASNDAASDVGLYRYGNNYGRKTRDPATASAAAAAAAAAEERHEKGDNAVNGKVLESALEAIRHRVKHHRVHLRPFFQAS